MSLLLVYVSACMIEVFHIPLTREQVALVDKDDYERLKNYCWQAQPNRTKTKYYAVRNNGFDERGTRLKVKMHREIMNAPPGLDVDHINGDTLDNRKENLRICQHINNIQNQKSRGGKSPYRGVTKHKKGWRARITVNYERKCLGVYSTQEEARGAYIEATKKYYREN